MPWNEADRVKYHVIRERYSSDLSDEEFGLIFPLLPTRKRRGRKRRCAREILNALFYLIRSGCPWRLLPRIFRRSPPCRTVSTLGGQRIMDANRRRPRDERARSGWP